MSTREEWIAETKRRAAVMLAACEPGAQLQFDSGSQWIDTGIASFVVWNWQLFNYRIKPKPIERWMVAHAGSDDRNDRRDYGVFSLRENAQRYIDSVGCPAVFRIVHLREVT